MGDSMRFTGRMLGGATYLAFLGAFAGTVIGVFLECTLAAVGPIDPANQVRGGSDGKIVWIAAAICAGLGFLAGLVLAVIEGVDGPDGLDATMAAAADPADADTSQLLLMGAVAGAVAAGLAAGVAAFKQGKLEAANGGLGLFSDVWMLESLSVPFRHMLVFGFGSAVVGSIVGTSLGLVFGAVFEARTSRPAFPVRAQDGER